MDQPHNQNRRNKILRNVSYYTYAVLQAMNQKTHLSTLFIALCFPLFAAVAEGQMNKTLFDRLAVKGFDPVSYFTEGKPFKGIKSFEFKYLDAKWRFSRVANLKAFRANPQKYAPEFGGYGA